MAADSLTQTAEEMDGVELVVETQGSSAVTPVASEVIDAADAVIFATDVGVKDRERFVGKPVIESGVKRAINEPKKMIEEAVAASKNPNAYRVTGGNGSAEASADAEGAQLGWGKRIQQAVMTGVSYMVPFVAAGGCCLRLVSFSAATRLLMSQNPWLKTSACPICLALFSLKMVNKCHGQVCCYTSVQCYSLRVRRPWALWLQRCLVTLRTHWLDAPVSPPVSSVVLFLSPLARASLAV